MFIAVLHIDEESPTNGCTLAKVIALTGGRLRVTRIERGENLTLAKLPVSVIRAGDRLFVNDLPENLKEFEQVPDARPCDGSDQGPVAVGIMVLVYGAGGYTFRDYTRVGAPLLLLMSGVFAIILPVFYPAV